MVINSMDLVICLRKGDVSSAHLCASNKTFFISGYSTDLWSLIFTFSKTVSFSNMGVF